MKIVKKSFLTALVVAAIALTVSRPEIYVASASEGIRLWALVVLPTLLPFFFLSQALVLLKIPNAAAKTLEKPTRKIFATSGIASYVFVMSVLSGYPVGAKIIADLKEKNVVSKEEATKISTFCSTSGPLFIISSVGVGMFKDKNVGVCLFVSHVFSAVLTGIVFRFYRAEPTSRALPLSSKNEATNALYEAIYSSVISVAVIGGFVCVFYVFADMAENTGIILPLVKLADTALKDEKLSSAFISGLIECTRGCKNAALTGVSVKSVVVSEALISFGGVSVIAQSVAFLKKAEVKTGVFLLAKIIQTTVSALLCFLFVETFLY